MILRLSLLIALCGLCVSLAISVVTLKRERDALAKILAQRTALISSLTLTNPEWVPEPPELPKWMKEPECPEGLTCCTPQSALVRP